MAFLFSLTNLMVETVGYGRRKSRSSKRSYKSWFNDGKLELPGLRSQAGA
ncbi:MAG TPA: hypothetical protein VFM80_09690 [Gracilimonas sp.]|nr:hypothetical protein [Gracilimonas sp.]